MTTGVDYSAARYTSGELKAKGIVAVGRYLTGPYAISRAELDELVAGGISVWFIFEYGINNVAGGSAQGAADARTVNAALEELGLPASQPVYFTIDEDLVNPSEAVPYFQGIDSARPAADTGDYAEGAVCQVLEADGLVGFNWQTESKAFAGNAVTLPITAIQQEPTGAPLAATDLDELLKSDFGQYPRPAAAPSPTTQEDDDMAMQMCDPESGKTIATDANGNFYADAGIGDIGITTLGEHPDWKAGEAESAGSNPCVGIVPWKDPIGHWGYCYITKPAGGKGALGPYSTYHIGRDGTPH